MKPALLSAGRGFHGCNSYACPRSLIPAEQAETAAWRALTDMFGQAAEAIATVERHGLVAGAFVRVTVGDYLVEVHYQWRAEA